MISRLDIPKASPGITRTSPQSIPILSSPIFYRVNPLNSLRPRNFSVMHKCAYVVKVERKAILFY